MPQDTKLTRKTSNEEVSCQSFVLLLEKILDDAYTSDNNDCSSDITTQLQNLNIEAAKLKVQGGKENVETDKLICLLTLLQTYIHKATQLHDSNNNCENKLFEEAAMEKITKAVNASLASLQILTISNLSSLVYSEDSIDQILIFTKSLVLNTINPIFDESKAIRTKACYSKRRLNESDKKKCYLLLAQKINEIIVLLSELLDVHKLTDSLVLQVSSLGVSAFFRGCNALSLSSIILLTKVFSKYEKHRKLLIDEILTSVSKNKHNLQFYKIRSGMEINMLSALFLQFVQSSTPLNDNSTANSKRYFSDEFLLNKYSTVTMISFTLLNEFLKKSTINKSDDVNCRKMFDNFIHDLLRIFTIPEWPVAELLLNVLSNLLINNLVRKNTEVSLRLVSLDYLGLMAAHLKFYSTSQEKNIENINRIMEKMEQENGANAQGNFQSNTSTGVLHKIETVLKLLLNYLSTKCEQDNTALYARHFCLTIWYSYICSKISSLEPKNEIKDTKIINDNRLLQMENSNNEVTKKLKEMKLFLKNEISKNIHHVKFQEYLDSDDITELYIYLLSRRPFYQNFKIYLSLILKGLTEQSTLMRAKAMKCLSSLVEIDPNILDEIHVPISSSFLDQSAQVREVAIDLIGKFIHKEPNLITKYYDVLNTRILDTAVSVRKRVIKILIDVCLEYPEFSKLPEVYVKIINRITDEESVVNQVVDVFRKIWFTPVKEKPAFESQLLVKKVKNMTNVLMISNETSVECVEKLINNIFKIKDKNECVSAAGKQIVDCLIETIIHVEKKPSAQKRLLSCITMLYLISKTEPKLLVMHASTLQPYLMLKCNNKIDNQILNYVAKILEQIIPLIDHPSDILLARLEEDYVKLIMKHDPAIITTCVSCLISIVNNLTKNYKLIKDCFNLYYGFIRKAILLIRKNSDSIETTSDIKPSLNRSLFVVGLLIQHFDFDKIEFRDDSIPKNVKVEVAENLFYLLKINGNVQYCVLKAFGAMSIRYSDLMLMDELKSFYIQQLLHKDSTILLKVQILNNIENYLVEEDKKWAKKDEKWSKHSKKENLKDLSDVNLGMASNIVQVYLSSVLKCMLDSNEAVRSAALRVVQVILTQGVVFPLSVIPYLIAMSTDKDKVIRSIVEKHLHEIETKYSGYTHYKALQGVELSYDFQKLLNEGSIVRGFSLHDTESTPRALTSFVYMILKTKQQKRSLIMSFIRHIEEKTQNSPLYTVYLADNLAYFPYRLQDEVLFVIYQINVTLSIAGTNLLEMFQGNLKPLDNKTPDEQEEEQNADLLLQRFPEDTMPLQLCINSAQGCLLLGLLKQYLMTVYWIKNEKISHYCPSENSKLYDKQIARKTEVPCFSADTFLENLSNNRSDNKSLILQYLQLKSLINSVDPEDFLENCRKPYSICDNKYIENMEECAYGQQTSLGQQNEFTVNKVEEKTVDKRDQRKGEKRRKRQRTTQNKKKVKISRNEDD